MSLFRRENKRAEGLSMRVADVFFIEFGGKGTVLLGQLEGAGAVRVGDQVVHQGREYPVRRIEVFRKTLKEAGPGTNVGLALGPEIPPDGFKGAVLGFCSG